MKQKSVVLFIFWGLDVKIKLLSSELLVDIQNVLTGLLEVTRWVVRAGHPKSRFLSVLERSVQSGLAHKDFKDRA
jgi:hypothetical protein